MKKNIMFFILGFIIAGSIGVYAGTRITADDIEYSEGISVKAKIDDLYTAKDTTIANLQSQIADLTGTQRVVFGTFLGGGFFQLGQWRNKYTKFKIDSVSCGSGNTGTLKMLTSSNERTTNVSLDTTYLTNDYNQVEVYNNGNDYCGVILILFN